jgi:hypothetical protein
MRYQDVEVMHPVYGDESKCGPALPEQRAA